MVFAALDTRAETAFGDRENYIERRLPFAFRHVVDSHRQCDLAAARFWRRLFKRERDVGG